MAVFLKVSLLLSELPSQLSLGQDQGHQQEVRSHAQSAEAEDEAGLCSAPWMTLEHLGRV